MRHLSPIVLATALFHAVPISAMADTTAPVVPALNGAVLAQLQGPAPGSAQLPPARGSAAPTAAAAASAPSAAMPAPPPPPPAPSPLAVKPRRATPTVPTASEIASMERRLAIARSQARAASATESGTVRGERASYVRAKVVFPYYDKSLFEVHTSPDRMTAIELQPGERITTSDGLPKAADTVNWVVSTVESGEGATKTVSVLVKPRDPGQETNLLIPTNRRSYHVVLRADSQAYMPIVGFSYPFDEAKAEQARVRAEETDLARKEVVAVSPEQIRFGYSIKGSDVEWKPLRVFDDGLKTYIQMPLSMRTSEAPALFVMEDEKDPMLVNYRLKGDYYIVDRLFSRAQLRVGKKAAVDIVREKADREEGFASWFTRH